MVGGVVCCLPPPMYLTRIATVVGQAQVAVRGNDTPLNNLKLLPQLKVI